MNQLYYGDNLEILRKYIKEETIDLCYIDPPFNSKRNYNQIYNRIGEDDRAQAQAFVDTWSWNPIADEGLDEIRINPEKRFTLQTITLIQSLESVLGKSDLMAYLISITIRVTEIYRVLKNTGSFYFHCDPTASHYLKLVLDSIFCSQSGDFKNEIIWHYKKWSIEQKQFVSNHDVIFFYTKSDSKDRTFNQLFMPRAASTLKRFGNAKIISGHDESGKRLPSQTEEGEESKGVAMDDVWDIGRVPPVKQLYPTQKPDALLERIIAASSNPGDVILDVYCGCGTTVMAAEKMHRKWIGVDITYQSISLILKRIEEGYGDNAEPITVAGIPEDFESAEALANKADDRTRKEFEKWLVLTYSNNKALINEKKGGDKGIDGISYVVDIDSSYKQEFKKVLFSVKSDKKLSPSVVRDLNGTMEREGAVMGILLTLYPMKNLEKECKQYGLYKNKMIDKTFPKIQVFSVADILNGERMGLQISTDVLKKTEQQTKNNQQGLF